MEVHLYTIVWNEEEMLPFFFRHYDSLVRRYIVYDDGSTDRTLEILAAHDRVDVRPFVRTHPDSYVLSAQSLHDSVWKESRGRADWVIITAVDEHLYHPAGLGRYLRIASSCGVTAVPALAFQMVTDTFPAPHEYLTRSRRCGVPLDQYNKLSAFNPNAIVETRYDVGRHSAAPEGRVQYPNKDQLLLFHYKFLGIDYLLRRYALLSSGLGARDKILRFGFQYDLARSELEAEFAELRRTAVDVTSKKARNLARKKWWCVPEMRAPPQSVRPKLAALSEEMERTRSDRERLESGVVLLTAERERLQAELEQIPVDFTRSLRA
jgi:glycosyltransferase involved in cell wall biosynthesis